MTTTLTDRLAWALNRGLKRLRGPRCMCGQRVHPRDMARHYDIEHAGEI